MRRFLYTCALTLAGMLALTRSASSQTYTVTDLGTFPGGTTSNALAIDRAGQITGWANGSYGASGSTYAYAFIYRDGRLESIGSLGGTSSVGYGIATNVDDKKHEDKTEKGALVTGAANTGSGATHAFLYKDGFLRDIGLLPGGTYSQGNTINRFGDIAGEADASNGIVNSFLYKHGTMSELPALGGEGGLALGINDAGDVTGTAGTANNESDAFLYCDGHIQDLGKLPLPGANYSTGKAINEAREITGDSGILAGAGNHGFFYSEGKIADMGLLPGGRSSSGMAINSFGQVVGVADVFVPSPTAIVSPSSVYVGHGILYTNGQMHDLNEMIAANSGWLLGAASGINDRGQIVGTGTINNEAHGYLLTPVCANGQSEGCPPGSGEPNARFEVVNDTGIAITVSVYQIPGAKLIYRTAIFTENRLFAELPPREVRVVFSDNKDQDIASQVFSSLANTLLTIRGGEIPGTFVVTVTRIPLVP